MNEKGEKEGKAAGGEIEGRTPCAAAALVRGLLQVYTKVQEQSESFLLNSETEDS